MGEFCHNFFFTTQLIPHKHCYLWQQELLGLHVVSDILIAVAYYTTALMLVYFVHKRQDLPFNGIFVMFSTSIVACGTSHLMEVWTLWYPAYWLSGCIKAITALVGVWTALALMPLISQALGLVSPAQLKVANEALLNEITLRKAAESALLKANAQLEIRVAQRTAELTSLNASLSKEIAEHQRAEAKFRQMFERNMMIGLLFWDIEGNILDANDAFLKMVGYTRAELVSGAVRWKDLTPSEYSALDYKAIAQVAETGSAPPYEKEYIRKDGTRFPILIGGAFLEGSQQQGVCFVLDISDRQRAENELRESEQRFRQLAENINQVFWMGTPDLSQILYISPAYEEIWGSSCSQLLEQPRSWMDSVHPEDRERLEVALKKRQLGDYDEEYRIVRLDESVRWIRSRVFPIQDATGQVYRLAGIAEDITKRKRAEAEIRLALEKEKELSDLKSRFITTTSHEFRTPLTTISFSVGLLKNYSHNWSEEKKLTHFERIEVAIKQMTELLEDVLFIGKAEAGKLQFNPVLSEPEKFCGSLVEELQLITGNKHKIIFVNRANFVRPWLDEKLLRHILNNLLSNSIKYSPNGGEIHLEYFEKDEAVVFQIRDRGIGIPPEDQQRLFESFHRASNVENISGTGLGLAIVKKCVDLHGGQIVMESEVGVGTTFTVTLPLNS